MPLSTNLGPRKHIDINYKDIQRRKGDTQICFKQLGQSETKSDQINGPNENNKVNYGFKQIIGCVFDHSKQLATRRESVCLFMSCEDLLPWPHSVSAVSQGTLGHYEPNCIIQKTALNSWFQTIIIWWQDPILALHIYKVYTSEPS